MKLMKRVSGGWVKNKLAARQFWGRGKQNKVFYIMIWVSKENFDHKLDSLGAIKAPRKSKGEKKLGDYFSVTWEIRFSEGAGSLAL